MYMLVQVTENDQSKFGIKRTCRSCGVCFYDLDKHPSECTNCGAIYELHVNTRSRRTVNIESFDENVSFLDLDHEGEVLPDIMDEGIIEDDNPFDTLLDDE